MRTPLHILTLALAFSMCPGFLELVDDGVHIVVDGHSDHAEGEDACPEHGCSATAHHCGCCASIAASTSPVQSLLNPALLASWAYPAGAASASPHGVTADLARPPIA